MFTCEYCQNNLQQENVITAVKDNRLHLFCCNKCKDKWICVIDPKNQLRFF